MLKPSDYILHNDDKYFCDKCGKPTYKYSRFHIGAYAKQVESNYTEYFCEECFVEVIKEYLKQYNYKSNK